MDYIVTHNPDSLPDGKIRMTEAALFSVDNGMFMATYYLTTLAGPMIITLKNVTHWMEVPEIEE
mgnify:CR=1 FL=1